MRIECKTTFLDGAERFEEGDIRTVNDADGKRFIRAGWAVEEGHKPAPVAVNEAVTLQVQRTRHAQKERKHG